MVGGAVAEEGDADVVAALRCARAHADADRVPDAGADDAVGAEQPDRAVVEMHRAAAPAADAVGLAEELGHHPPRIGALGERMAVAAMRRGHPVGPAQVRADADAGRLLADVEMQEARRLALAAGDLRHALEPPQQHHPLEEPEQRLPVRQVGYAPRHHASVLRSSSRPPRPERLAARLTASLWYR